MAGIRKTTVPTPVRQPVGQAFDKASATETKTSTPSSTAMSSTSTPSSTPSAASSSSTTSSVASAAPVNSAFESSAAQVQARQTTGEQVQKTPSQALSQPARIMSPHLLFQDATLPSKASSSSSSLNASTSSQAPTSETADKPIDHEDWFKALLEKPFVPSSSTTAAEGDPGPMLARLPPDRHVSVGAIRYTHDDGVLRVVGEPKAGGKPEVQEKKVGLGVAARYLAAYDAAIAAQYPKWDTSGREPPELWIALDAASKAATMAEKLDVGARSPHDAAKLLRSFMPKAGGIVATKTTMEQIQAFAGIAKAVTDGDPKKNLVDLEEKVLNAQGSSLLEAMKRDVSGTFPTLTWITTAAGFSMDQDARRAASDITRDFGDVIAAQATVIETGGFQGAAVRMIISGMDLVAGTRSPTKTFATLEECIPWCQLFNAAPGVDNTAVLAAVVDLRTR